MNEGEEVKYELSVPAAGCATQLALFGAILAAMGSIVTFATAGDADGTGRRSLLVVAAASGVVGIALLGRYLMLRWRRRGSVRVLAIGGTPTALHVTSGSFDRRFDLPLEAAGEWDLGPAMPKDNAHVAVVRSRLTLIEQGQPVMSISAAYNVRSADNARADFGGAGWIRTKLELMPEVPNVVARCGSAGEGALIGLWRQLRVPLIPNPGRPGSPILPESAVDRATSDADQQRKDDRHTGLQWAAKLAGLVMGAILAAKGCSAR